MVMATVTGMALSIVIVLLMVMAEMVALRISKIKRGRSVGFRKYNPEHEAGKNKGVQNCISFFIDLCILGVSVTKLWHNCKLLTV